MIGEVDSELVKWLMNNGLAVGIIVSLAVFAYRIIAPAITKSVERLSAHLDRAETAMDKHADSLDKACATLDAIGKNVSESAPLIRDIHNHIKGHTN